MSSEDNELQTFLSNYLDKLRNNTISCEEKMNLIDFFIHDTANSPIIDVDLLSPRKLQQYATLGWYISTILNK